MRIVFLGRYPPVRCGVAEYTFYLVRELRRQFPEHEVIVLANTDTHPDAEFGLIDGVKVVRCFSSTSPDYGAVLKTLEEIGGADILHVQHEYGIFPPRRQFVRFLAEAKKFVRRLVVTLHTVYAPVKALDIIIRGIEPGADVKWYMDAVSTDYEMVSHQRKIVEIADAVIVHSILQEFELWMQLIDISKVYKIPHGTFTNPYSNTDKETLLKMLNIPGVEPETPLVTVPGFLRVDKGLDILLKAFEKVAKETNAVLVIGGSTPQKHAQVRELVQSSVSRHIKFIDKFLTRKELYTLLAAADLIVLPYREKRGSISVSGVLHLAMGSKRPIVATRVPRLVEYYTIAPELCTPPENPEKLAEKIIYALHNKDKLKKYVDRVWEYAIETSWPNTAKKHVQLYTEILK